MLAAVSSFFDKLISTFTTPDWKQLLLPLSNNKIKIKLFHRIRREDLDMTLSWLGNCRDPLETMK